MFNSGKIVGNKGKRSQRLRQGLALLLAVLMMAAVPSVSLGAAASFGFFTPVSSSDYNLTTGVSSTVNIQLWDNASPANPYVGSVSGYISGTNASKLYSFGSMSPQSGNTLQLTGVQLNTAGTYTLFVTSGSVTATGSIYVTDAKTPTPTPVTHHLSYFTFVSTSDHNLITGETDSINFRMWDEEYPSQPFNGNVTAYIVDPSGNSTSYTVQGSSLNNVTLDTAGTYTLVLTDSYGYSASGTITVTDAKLTTTGSLRLNYDSTVTVKLTDANGNPLARRSVTVDASNVGGMANTYTTLYDGTFSYSLTPTTLGTVNFIHGGHTIGTLQVQPDYTPGTRIGGSTQGNPALSVAVTKEGWASAGTVILTRDDVVADAMVAVPLSKRYDAPILMTDPTSLDSGVLSEMYSLGAKTVFVIGGTGAVSSTITDQLTQDGFQVTRFAGVDRYDTAAKIAAWVGSPGTVYLAYGYGEPDALAAGALAAEQGIPILLTDTHSLPSSTQTALNQLAPTDIDILGGTGVVGSDLKAALSTKYSVQRWGGADRYQTEQIIFQNFFNQEPALDQYPLYLASALVLQGDVSSGRPYGDALVAAALAAKNNGFVVTLPPNDLPSALSTFLLFNKAYIPSATAVGNSSAISPGLEQQVQQLLAH